MQAACLPTVVGQDNNGAAAPRDDTDGAESVGIVTDSDSVFADSAVADPMVSDNPSWISPYCGFSYQAPLSLQLDYLQWWFSGNSLPPLVTTSPVGFPPVLGLPTTSVLFGDDKVDARVRGGFRGTLDVHLAHWFDTGLEIEGQLIVIGNGQKTGDYFVESTGIPVLGRPFFNVQTNAQDQLPVAAPGLAFPDPVLGVPDPTVLLDEAFIETDTTSDLVAAGILFRHNWTCNRTARWDVLAGYRYLRFEEDFAMFQFQAFSDPADAGRTGDITLVDSFSTASEFNGFDMGVETHWCRGGFAIELLTKLAVGNVHQISRIRGSSLTNRPEDGDPATPQVVANDYGFLTAPSNIGRYTANQFGVVPELGITLRRSLTRSASLAVGYNLIAFTKVLRTGDQIDIAIDPSQVLPQPSATLNDSTLLIQGIHVGIEF